MSRTGLPGPHCRPLLDSYLEGVLPERPRARVERHLADCPDCRAVARQRAGVLQAARSVDTRPEAGPVMRRQGVSGRLVVGILSAVVLLGALLTAVWIAGAPDAAEPDAEASSAAGSASLADVGSASASDAESMMAELRERGWTLPSLMAAGLRPLTVELGRQGEEIVEVAVAWGRSDPLVTVVERRRKDADAGPDTVEADTVHLDVGADYRIEDRADEGWTADLTTAESDYHVEADLPRNQAVDVLTQLVLSERSGLAEVGHTDGPGERLERGLDRIRHALPTGTALGGTHGDAP